MERPVANAGPATLGIADFALFAPRNEKVELLAEWNQFRPVAMAKGEDGWWRARAELPDGSYRYRFRVKSLSWFALGQDVEVGDPYALELDHEGSEDAIVRMKDGKRVWVDYQWQHDKVPLPTNDKLVIYEMHVGDFTGSTEQIGTFESTIQRLDYLKDLGINAVELLPVKEFAGRNWGYCLKSLFAVEQMYGRPEELCHLVDECHARGIRVIVDGVFNHMHMDAWMAKIDYELWFHRVNPDGPELDFGPKCNFRELNEQLGFCPALKYVCDAIGFMVEKYHIDGIRFDCTRAIRDFKVLRNLTDCAYHLVADRKPFICIAEHVPEDAEITGRERGAPMDAAWCDYLATVLRSVTALAPQHDVQPDVELLLKQLDPESNGYGNAFRMITFLSNHDHHRPMQVIGEDGHMFGDAAFRRMKLGHGLLLAGPGIPMLWMGSEFGMPGEKTQEPRPLQWSLLEGKENAELHAFHRTMIGLRKEHAALRSGTFGPLLADRERMVLAFRRWAEDGDEVIVLANAEEKPAGEVRLEGIADGAWVDALSGEGIDAAGGAMVASLGPSQLRVFVKRSS